MLKEAIVVPDNTCHPSPVSHVTVLTVYDSTTDQVATRFVEIVGMPFFMFGVGHDIIWRVPDLFGKI